MNFKLYSTISLLLVALAPDFTLCSDNQMVYRFSQAKLVDFSCEPIEMDYQQKEKSKDAISPKTENLLNEKTQLIPSAKKKLSKKFRCEWPYQWKYSSDDEAQWEIDNRQEGAIRTHSCLIAMTFGIFAASNTFVDQATGCSFCDSTVGGITFCTCAASWLIATCSPCLNQKAWDNGDYCNRCVRKREN